MHGHCLCNSGTHHPVPVGRRCGKPRHPGAGDASGRRRWNRRAVRPTRDCAPVSGSRAAGRFASRQSSRHRMRASIGSPPSSRLGVRGLGRGAAGLGSVGRDCREPRHHRAGAPAVAHPPHPPHQPRSALLDRVRRPAHTVPAAAAPRGPLRSGGTDPGRLHAPGRCGTVCGARRGVRRQQTVTDPQNFPRLGALAAQEGEGQGWRQIAPLDAETFR